ncbi:globin-like [Physella acuta]|uniref:globin-like n=1 Tax=Physella acuta TaxID=109671 RepID=UPI0027DE9166|nr:globin-like [Physella acuta]XP_059165569.1 globin-like [Physella acuta]XP_059165570.1 globin-like [Physella acuta]XP_059165571.1 globin-like [Physella acuta]XP_059165572.1 globin-like [Physella acuta]
MGGLLSYLISWVAPSRPAIKYDPTPDPTTGLTQREKQLIMETWALAGDRKTVKENGLEFFIQLFTAYPYMQNYFDLFKGKSISELRSSPKLKAHATSVMYAITSYVENVEDSENLVGLVQKIAVSHIGRGIKVDDFEKLKIVFLKFLTTYLGERCTPEIETAWTKLLTAHNAVYKMTEDEVKGKK